MIEFTEEELNALYRFFDRGIVGGLTPMEVVQACARGQLVVASYMEKAGMTLHVKENENATNNR